MQSNSSDPASRPTVAHLVSPYLFLTGSWIQAQLEHNHEFRPVVLTQARENADTFDFDDLHVLGPGAGLGRLLHTFQKYALGTYPLAGYRTILDQERVAVLHAHLGWEGARTVPLARNPRRPFVVSFYGRDATLLARHPYWRILYKRLFRLADRVVAEGSYMGRTLESIGVPPERVRVVHLGVDPTEFSFRERRAPAGDEPIVGLISASFREKKGIPYALEALAHVAAEWPRLRLRIIGDGPDRPQIEALIARLNLEDRVELLGYQPYPRYCEELGKVHFLVAASVTAADGDSEGGAPVCLLEAQACGLPIIATTHCDIPEVTVPDQSAFLAAERDVEGLAAQLRRLLSSPDGWPEMGRAGRRHIETEFDIRRQVERMNEVYRELLPASG